MMLQKERWNDTVITQVGHMHLGPGVSGAGLIPSRLSDGDAGQEASRAGPDSESAL